MQGDTCTKNAIELKHMVAVAMKLNEDDVHENFDLTSIVRYFGQNDLGLIEADLNKYQTLERIQRSMKLLRIIIDSFQIRIRDSPFFYQVDLYKSAAEALNNGCPSENQPNNQI